MKKYGMIGMGVSLLTGILLSYGWHRWRQPEVPPEPPASTAGNEMTRTTIRERPAFPERRASGLSQGFSFESAEKSLAHYDTLMEPDPLAEARLRCLMFAVPKAHLEDVLHVMLGMENPDKFQDLACALFSRWTELDPEAALNALGDAGVFSSEARRGVVTTWLNTDPDAALEHLLTDKSSEDTGFIKEFLLYKGVTKPEEAARLVDRISAEWPEADSGLFASVANQWAKFEPERAAKWAASYEDKSISQPLLKQMAVEVSRLRGRPALEMCGLISDLKLRQEARNDVMNNWGRNYGGFALNPEAGPDRNISQGFPTDWTNEDIKTFSRAFVDNFADKITDLLEIAKDDSQRLLIYEGAVAGVENIDPGKVRIAVESLPERYAQDPEGKKILEAYIQRWHHVDAEAANSWLAAQPPGLKTDVMGAGLGKKEGQP